MDPIRKRKIFLNQLNQDLQIEFNTKSLVLNQNQIDELARLNPVKTTDLKAIKGLGDQFIEAYGDLIIERLKAFDIENTPLDNNNQIQKTIKELEKRLINISKRNRLLYVPKVSPKTTYDLFSLGTDVLNELLFENKKVELVNLNQENAKERYNSLNDIYKNVNRAYKETGNFDCYIATPFVTGQFISDPFTIRAPLVLFPVNIFMSNTHISVQVDSLKDVLINTNLLVAAQHFLKTNHPLIPMNLEEVNQETFLLDILEAYRLSGLSIIDTQQPLEAFQSKTIESFKDNKPGVFEIENGALLGFFPILSTSIQRDYAAINQLESYPPHVITLLETINQEHDQEDEAKILDDVVFKEEHLAYINPLNTSQEQAQLHIKKGQHMVISGPPGTGKSQAISNVIAQCMYDNKNVLMVSEKKAAIDVVYSRLSHLNQYALILANINDKQNFYQQCERLFIEKSKTQSTPSLNNHNQSMQESIEELEHLATLLTTKVIDDYTLIDLYTEVDKINYLDEMVFDDYDKLKQMVDPHFYSSYQSIKELDLDNFQDILTQISLNQSLGSFSTINKNLSDYDLIKLKGEWPALKKELESIKQANPFAKLFSKNKTQALLEPLKNLKRDINLEEIHLVDLILDNYPLLIKEIELKADQNIYLLIEKIASTFNETPEVAKARLVNFIGFEGIQNFENQHRELHDLLSNYDNLVNSFNESATEKSELLQVILSHQLAENQDKLKASKRALEMQRIIERKRKWSISKFVDRFYVELFNGIKIWLCTPDVVSEIFPLKPDLFDVLIFDEASQLYIEKAIPSILRSKQVVIAGDSQQLRPSAFGVGRYGYDEELEDEFIDSTAALDEESLLDLARFKFSSLTLNYHYRSLYEELIAFSNAAFYKNQLLVSPNALNSPIAPIKVIKVDNGLWEKRANKIESQRVVSLVKEISEARQANETIGIITFNATQRALIEKDLEDFANTDKAFGDFYAIEKNREEDNQDLSLFVKNIENVQGDERDIIIFSITYAPDEAGKVPSFFGWLSQQGGENRLNVAVTRAKKQIFVVTSIAPYQLPVKTSTYKGPKLLQEYLSYSLAVSDQDTSKIDTLLNQLSDTPPSLLIEKPKHKIVSEVEAFLSEHGYHTQYQVGLGHFTIELAVYKEAELIGGFEFDYGTYFNQLSTRARDIHQPNYLKARKWKIHRLFSYHYYHQKEAFFNSILTKLS